MEKNSSINRNEVNVGTISLQISQEFSLVGRGGTSSIIAHIEFSTPRIFSRYLTKIIWIQNRQFC